MTLPKFEHVLSTKPFEVAIPKKAKATKGKWITTVVYGDRHGICADDRAEDVLYAILDDLQPDIVVNIGDDVDCYTISDFDKNPNRIHTLQDEIDNTRTHLHKVSQIVPKADKYWLEGNHEDRLRRLVWRLPGASSELARLKVIREGLTWPALVGTADIGWEFVPIAKQASKVILPKLIIKHGTKLAAHSAFTAKMEHNKYGKSGLSGHTHRLGVFYHKDYNGSHVWAETGCLCDLHPEYTPDPDWQQGLVIVTTKSDGTWFNVEPVYIEKGRASRGTTFYQA